MSLVIAPRFNGPPNSGNGGYVAGRLAGLGSSGARPRARSRSRPVAAAPRRPARGTPGRRRGGRRRALQRAGSRCARAASGIGRRSTGLRLAAGGPRRRAAIRGSSGPPVPDLLRLWPRSRRRHGVAARPGQRGNGRRGLDPGCQPPQRREHHQRPRAGVRVGRTRLPGRLVDRSRRPSDGARPDDGPDRADAVDRRGLRRRREPARARRPQGVHRVCPVRRGRRIARVRRGGLVTGRSGEDRAGPTVTETAAR